MNIQFLFQSMWTVCKHLNSKQKPNTLSDSDRIWNIYMCVCVYTSSVDYFLIVLLWSIHFSNKNVSLFNSNKKLLSSDKPKFWTELRVLSGCTAMPDTVTTKLLTNPLRKRLRKQVCLQLLQQSRYSETTPNICGYE